MRVNNLLPLSSEDIDQLDFSSEAENLVDWALNELQKDTKSLSDFSYVVQNIEKLIGNLNECQRLLSQAAQQRKKIQGLLKTLKNNKIDTSNLSIEEIENYRKSLKGRGTGSRLNTQVAYSYIKAEEQLITIMKSNLLSAYKIIMSLRSFFISDEIVYGIFFSGVKNGINTTIMTKIGIDELVEQATITKDMNLRLTFSGEQIQSIINDCDKLLLSDKFENIIQTDEDQKVWDTLIKIKNKLTEAQINSKKIRYNFGQLLEASMFLKNKELNTNNIFQALKQGANTTRFSTSGDFFLNGLDIQAKLFQSYSDQSKNIQHSVTILRLDAIKNVLIEIQSAFVKATTTDELKRALYETFTKQGGSFFSFDEETEKAIKAKIKEVLEDVKK